MVPYRGISNVEVIPLDLTGGPLRVVISRQAAAGESAAVREAWEKLCAANPRHFDAPILSVLYVDGERNEVRARRDRYMRLAVQPLVQTGVRLLAVTGVLVARDASGREHVLLGKRARDARIYGGMWELGPSGGLQAPPEVVTELDTGMLFRNLAEEIDEEVGTIKIAYASILGICRDHKAMSDDIVYFCGLESLEAVLESSGPKNWEYAATQWVATDVLRAWEEVNEVIAPTRALFRALGWIETT